MRQKPRFRPRPALVAALTATLLGAAATTPADAATGGYVALGDSYVAGPGIPEQDSGSGVCTRSDHNYPSLAATAVHPSSFTDVSCSAAVTADMTGRQYGVIAPQFDALKADTRLVTVTIGGNDAGFAEVVATCSVLGVFDSAGAPCKDHYTAGGTDELLQRLNTTAPKVGAVLRGIHQRSPQARVLLVGYPRLLPDTKARCAVDVPIATGDVPYLSGIERRYNELIAAQATANGADFVDLHPSSTGHDLCQTSGTRWIEGITDVENAIPVHPNALGMTNAARQIQTKLGG